MVLYFNKCVISNWCIWWHSKKYGNRILYKFRLFGWFSVQTVYLIIKTTISLGNNQNFNCSDCRNYWLIKENKQNQVTSSYCKDQSPSKLFDEEIKNKFKQECESNFKISQNW